MYSDNILGRFRVSALSLCTSLDNVGITNENITELFSIVSSRLTILRLWVVSSSIITDHSSSRTGDKLGGACNNQFRREN